MELLHRPGVAVSDFDSALSGQFVDPSYGSVRYPENILGLTGDVNAIHEEGGELFGFDFTG